MYKVRVYVTSEKIGLFVNDMIDNGLIRLVNSFDGKGGVLAIYDGLMPAKAIKMLISFKVLYFPLDNYGSFKITCPYCGQPINDDMILTIYDDDLLRGFNIECYHDGCGKAIANVEFLLD